MKPVIHQFTPWVALGDGVTQGVFYFQELLLELGFDSVIYARHIDAALQDKVSSIDQYQHSSDHGLLYHYSILDDDAEKIMAFDDYKVIVYHNITPAHFFPEKSFLRHICHQARIQLRELKMYFEAALADSAYSAQELVACGYPTPVVLPILVKPLAVHAAPDQSILQAHQDFYTILYVGRIVPNKCQHQLVETIYALNLKGIKNVHLILVGGISDPDYAGFLKQRIVLLGLENRVHITGKVDESALNSYYRAADLYLSLSDHEGFGMPLIEAMQNHIPLLAYATTACAELIAPESRLQYKNPAAVADAIASLMQSPATRRTILAQQKRVLHRFSAKASRLKLHDWLCASGFASQMPAPPPCREAEAAPQQMLVEGPFDSTYSLAKVNRDVARSLHAGGWPMAMHATDGGGDFAPDVHFLQTAPDITAWHQAYSAQTQYAVVIRNVYPPRSNAMHGDCKIMGPYGWEESVFPANHMTLMNQRLDYLWCMSEYVRRTMINNGLTVPALTTGIIADDILSSEACAVPFSLPKGWILLHISSAFPRKGIDVLFEAYVGLAAATPDALLLLKTFPNPHNVVSTELAKHAFAQVDSLSPLATLWKRADGMAVLWINGDLPLPQMRWLYQVCDVLVAPGCGEGFGLPLAEAMLLQLPVITTAYGGQCDFCTADTAWLVDYDFEPAKTHMALFDSVWAKPRSADLLAQLMAVKTASPESIHIKTQAARRLVQSRYTSTAFLKTITPLLATPAQPAAQPAHIGWISTWNTACGIAIYSEHLVQHIQTPLTLLAACAANTVKADSGRTVRCWNDQSENNFEALDAVIAARAITHLMLQFNYNFFNFAALSDWIKRLSAQGIRLCITLHATVDPDRDDKKLALLACALQTCHRIFVHSVNDLNRLKKINIINNVVLFPLGILASAPHPKLPRATSAIQLASYGFFLPNKGLMELIEAVAILRGKGHDIQAHLVNARYPLALSKALIDAARQRIEALALAPHVRLSTDFLPDHESLAHLAQTDLIVYPYQATGESASAAVRYGIASGVPVAVTPLPIFDDIKEVVFVLPGLSPQAIADGIDTILGHLDAKSQAAQRWKDAHQYAVLAPRLEAILLH